MDIVGKLYHVLAKFAAMNKKIKTEFSGSSPTEIFIGRYGYPKVFAGILSPQEHGNTSYMGRPEEWFSKNAQILDILNYRSRMIYSRFSSSIKYSSENEKLKKLMQEVAMTSSPVSMEFKLRKKELINKFLVWRKGSGNQDLIQNGINGLLVPNADPEKLADKVAFVLDNSESTRELGSRARKTIEEGYTIAIVADRYMELYQKLIEGEI